MDEHTKFVDIQTLKVEVDVDNMGVGDLELLETSTSIADQVRWFSTFTNLDADTIRRVHISDFKALATKIAGAVKDALSPN